MRLGEILLARGLVTAADIDEAARRQKVKGGRLGDNLIGLGVLTLEQLDEVMHETPKAPKSLEESGVSQAVLSSLLLKFMYVEQRESIADLMPALRLPYNIIKQLFEDVAARELVQVLGATAGSSGVAIGEVRYSLTQRGREAAAEAMERNLYIGPAPVSLAAFQEQIVKQRITNESLDEADIQGCFRGLVIPGEFLRKIGPAINAGRTILLYGPPRQWQNRHRHPRGRYLQARDLHALLHRGRGPDHPDLRPKRTPVGGRRRLRGQSDGGNAGNPSRGVRPALDRLPPSDGGRRR